MALLWLVPGAAGELLPVTAYSASQGLGHDHVRCAVRDPHGLLWFCTAVGLARFDGAELTAFGERDGLPSGRVHALVTPPGDGYYLATDDGLYRLDLGRSETAGQLFEAVAYGGGCQGTIHVLTEFQGELWAGCDGGLFRLVDETSGRPAFQPVAEDLLAGPVRALISARDGLWVGGNGWIALLADQAELRRWPLPVSWGAVRSLLAAADGRLWVGLERGLAILPSSAAATVEAVAVAVQEADKTVRSLFEDRQGTIWVGAVGGLVAIEAAGERLFTVASGLPDETVNAMVEDALGNLWLGTDVGGVARLLPDGLVSYGVADGMAHPSVSSLTLDRHRRLHVGADARGAVSRLEGDRFTGVIPNFPPALARLVRFGRVRSLQDRRGAWWFATAHGLVRFPPTDRLEALGSSRPRLFGIEDGLPSEDVYFVHQDGAGDLWLATAGGLARYRPGAGDEAAAIEALGPAEGLPSPGEPTALANGPRGLLWIGWSDGSLWRALPLAGGSGATAGDRPSFEPVPLEATAPVWDLFFDAAGRLWIATFGDGVYRLDAPQSAAPPSPRRYGLEEGLSSTSARVLTADRWGRIYVGGLQGVDRLDPAGGAVRHLTTAEGLAGLEVTAAQADAEGNLWFGTWSGLSRLVPRLDAAVPPPQVRLAGLRVDGRALAVSPLGEVDREAVVLPPGPHRLELSFFGVGFPPGAAERYRYRLGDDPWSEPLERRHLTLADVGGGRHRLQVRADLDGSSEKSPLGGLATVVFEVAQPLWKRGWFQLLAVLSVLALGWLLHRARLRRALALERVRTRIAADLHDDLGASLARISMLAEAARMPAREGDGTLAEIAAGARQLIARAREIVWSLEPRYDDLASLSVRVREVAGELLEPAGIRWSLQAPEAPQARKIRLRPEHRQHLLLVFKEALHNAVRHAGTERVEMVLAIRGRRLLGSIRDHGRGLPAGVSRASGGAGADLGSEIPGNGLRNMRRRLARLGGRLELRHPPQGGLEVVFSLLLNRSPWSFVRRAGRGEGLRGA